jgi:hypothetical protein
LSRHFSEIESIARHFSLADSPVLIDNIWQSGPALIVLGTATGVFASVSDYGSTGRWFRVGLCSELPMVCLNRCSLHGESRFIVFFKRVFQVMVQGVSYEAYSDTLVVATFGRGMFSFISLFGLRNVTFQQASTHFQMPSMRWHSRLPAKHLHLAAANPQRNLHHQRYGFLSKRVATRNPTNVNHFYSSMVDCCVLEWDAVKSSCMLCRRAASLPSGT